MTQPNRLIASKVQFHPSGCKCKETKVKQPQRDISSNSLTFRTKVLGASRWGTLGPPLPLSDIPCFALFTHIAVPDLTGEEHMKASKTSHQTNTTWGHIPGVP
jgi:hypothetical protein